VEEEAADVYRSYLASVRPGQTAKPVIGFVAGASTQRGLVYGHAGAVWWNPEETAEAKRQVWKDAGFVVADTLGDLGPLISEEAAKLRL
jgi:succinyl-CoA synthetase alpha subunit